LKHEKVIIRPHPKRQGRRKQRHAGRTTDLRDDWILIAARAALFQAVSAHFSASRKFHRVAAQVLLR
jgi:hypothetical protein